MKDLKNTRQLVNAMILSIVPILLISIGRIILGDNMFTTTSITLTICAYLFSALCIFLFNKYISHAKYFRCLKKYEGRWVEIIPDFPREISICKISFANDGYHFYGTNYSNSTNETVEFKSRKLFINENNEFFYITQSDQIPRPEGFGKVYSFSKSDEGFYKAKGYFVDVSVQEKPVIHKTFMIKFDSDFYDHNLNLPRAQDPAKLSDRKVYKLMKKYVEENHILEEIT